MNPDNDSSVGKNTTSKELFSAIGSLTIHFVLLEYSVMQTISISILSTNANFTLRLLAGDSFKVLLSKLKRIIHYQIKDKIFLSEFKIILTELNAIREQRNKFLHAIWTTGKGENKVVRFSLKADIRTEPILIENEQKTIEDIIKFLDRIKNAIRTLEDLNEKIIKLLSNEKEKNGNQEKENQKET